MSKYLSIMSNKTKWKCVGVITLAFVGFPARIRNGCEAGQMYTNISTELSVP